MVPPWLFSPTIVPALRLPVPALPAAAARRPPSSLPPYSSTRPPCHSATSIVSTSQSTPCMVSASAALALVHSSSTLLNIRTLLNPSSLLSRNIKDSQRDLKLFGTTRSRNGLATAISSGSTYDLRRCHKNHDIKYQQRASGTTGDGASGTAGDGASDTTGKRHGGRAGIYIAW
ncbi:hypothetical protein C8F01DRAFT_1302669 [Mycena amicta]|nr:hypothetical protein C8F01DRAFT_1302669 [Mycena amicta]